jgi:hypothetical protein
MSFPTAADFVGRTTGVLVPCLAKYVAAAGFPTPASVPPLPSPPNTETPVGLHRCSIDITLGLASIHRRLGARYKLGWEMNCIFDAYVFHIPVRTNIYALLYSVITIFLAKPNLRDNAKMKQ